MTKNKKYIIGFGLVAIIIVAISLYSVNQKENKEDSINTEISSETTSVESAVSPDSQVFSAAEAPAEQAKMKVESAEVVEDQEVDAKIDVLVNQYFDLTGDFNSDILTSKTKEDKKKGKKIFNRKKEIIEKYENINEIIKPGNEEGTYVVFASYDIKLKNVDTLVPGMSVLVVNKGESGELLINNAENDESLTAYINQIASEDDLKSMIEKVNENLAAAIKKDSSLKQLVEFLNDLS